MWLLHEKPQLFANLSIMMWNVSMKKRDSTLTDRGADAIDTGMKTSVHFATDRGGFL